MSEPTLVRTRRQDRRGSPSRTSRAWLLTGAIGALGIVCASSTTIWPTRIEALRTSGVGDVTRGFEHRIWSWGREAVYSTDGVRIDGYSGPTPTLSLVLLVVVLVLGAAGVGAWLLRPGHRGGLLGVAGTALSAAVVGQSVAARLAIDDRRLGPAPGLVVETPLAGRLEYAAALLLPVAFALMLVLELVPQALPWLAGAGARLVRSLAEGSRAVGSPAVGSRAGGSRAVGSRAEAAPDDEDAPRQVAVIRNVPSSEDPRAQGSSGPAGPGAGAVGFSDNVVE